MITSCSDFVNEKFDFFNDIIMFPITCKEKIKKIIDWPVVKYIEMKTKNLTDEEKLLKISEIANTLDKWFSPFNSLVGATVFSGLAAISYLIRPEIQLGWIEVYAMITAIVAYSSLNKEYRLLAKKNYKKIKKKFLDNIDRVVNDKDDPYGEEQWYDEEDDTIARADAIRYNKRFKHLEDMPFFGLHRRKDVEP